MPTTMQANPLISNRTDTNARSAHSRPIKKSKPITFIPDHARSSNFKPPSVDIFISSNFADTSSDLHKNQYQNHFVHPRAEASSAMQVISIPPSINSTKKAIPELVMIDGESNPSNENRIPLRLQDVGKVSNGNLTVHPISSQKSIEPDLEDKTETAQIQIPEATCNVISKLDLQERKMNSRRQMRDNVDLSDEPSDPATIAGLNESYEPQDDESDFSDFENLDDYEYWLHYKRILTKGPPLKPVNDPVKLKFLQQVGLISNAEKSEIELNQMIERQRLFEDIDCEVKIEHRALIRLAQTSSRICSKPSYLQPSKQLPSEINKKANRTELLEKRRFLQFLNLQPETDIDRIEHRERLWDGVIEEKQRRIEFDLCFTKIMDNLHPITKNRWLEMLLHKSTDNYAGVTINHGRTSAKKCLIVKNLKPNAQEGLPTKPLHPSLTSAPKLLNGKSDRLELNKMNCKKLPEKRKVMLNDFSSISWSALADFQKSFQKHLHGKKVKFAFSIPKLTGFNYSWTVQIKKNNESTCK